MFLMREVAGNIISEGCLRVAEPALETRVPSTSFVGAWVGFEECLGSVTGTDRKKKGRGYYYRYFFFFIIIIIINIFLIIIYDSRLLRSSCHRIVVNGKRL